jgi:hypothetical protein
MRELFGERPDLATAFGQWLSWRGFVLSGVVEDRSYGRFEIYARPAES